MLKAKLCERNESENCPRGWFTLINGITCGERLLSHQWHLLVKNREVLYKSQRKKNLYIGRCSFKFMGAVQSHSWSFPQQLMTSCTAVSDDITMIGSRYIIKWRLPPTYHHCTALLSDLSGRGAMVASATSDNLIAPAQLGLFIENLQTS